MMNITFFINTPAQAHFYTNIIKQLQLKGRHANSLSTRSSSYFEPS